MVSSSCWLRIYCSIVHIQEELTNKEVFSTADNVRSDLT